MGICSAAGHDAQFDYGICPNGMIFMPYTDGISHNPQKSATLEDLAAGARGFTEAPVEFVSH